MSSNISQSFRINSSDGTQLYGVMDRADSPKASVLLVHGFGEHCERYAELAQHLCSHEYSVLRFDYRGHGQSQGRRGHVYDFEDYIRDFETAKGHLISERRSPSPLFVLAHSYGGLISTHALSKDSSDVDGFVLSSPFFGFAIKVPFWKKTAGNLLSKYVPAFSMPTDIDPAIVSHDPDVVAAYGNDPLIGRVATSRWFTETQNAHRRLKGLAPKIQMPLLFQQAGDDRLVDAAAGRFIFDAFGSADKTWDERPGEFHEIWFETGRMKTISTVVRWLDSRCEQLGGQA